MRTDCYFSVFTTHIYWKTYRNLQADWVFDICGQSFFLISKKSPRNSKKNSPSSVPIAVLLRNTQTQTPWKEWNKTCLWCVQWRTHSKIRTVQEIRDGGFYKRSKCKRYDNTFMKHVKWFFFQIYYVSNTTQYIRNRLAIKKHFTRANDPWLKYLEENLPN